MGWRRPVMGKGERKERASWRVESQRVICEDAPAVVITWDLRAVVRWTRKAASEGRYRGRGWGRGRLWGVQSTGPTNDSYIVIIRSDGLPRSWHVYASEAALNALRRVQPNRSLALCPLLFRVYLCLPQVLRSLFLFAMSVRGERETDREKGRRKGEPDLTRSRSVRGAFFRAGGKSEGPFYRVSDDVGSSLRWRYCCLAMSLRSLNEGRKLTLKVVDREEFCFQRISSFSQSELLVVER